MSNTPRTIPPIPAEPVVPEGKDAVDNLTIGELDTASRKLGVSIDTAITKDVDGLKWRALAFLGWLWHKRTDPGAVLDSWLNVEVDELLAALRMSEDELDDDEAGEEAGDADEDPTASVRESS